MSAAYLDATTDHLAALGFARALVEREAGACRGYTEDSER